MEIEYLTFQLKGISREDFCKRDKEIWTETLSKFPGFIEKEAWLPPEDTLSVILVIRWNTLEHWKSIPQSVLDSTEKKFFDALGDVYTLIKVERFNVLK
jgi:uncharacterized protein (TIGR03792 family)